MGTTETLPAITDDIFATFGGSTPHVQGPAVAVEQVAAADPLGHLRQQPQPSPRGRPAIRRPEGGFLLLGGAGGLVVVLIVLVALLTGNRDEPAAASTPPVSTPSPAPEVIGTVPDGLAQVDGEEAADLLRRAGQATGGQIVEAWGWTDRNGRNLVATTSTNAGDGKKALRVIHLARLEGRPKTLRVMQDPDLPDCAGSSSSGSSGSGSSGSGSSGSRTAGSGTAGFTKDALIVRDLDGDNRAEVLVGWSSRCGPATSASQVRLALITDGDKYIVRGEGVIGSGGGGSLDPDPSASRWPDTFLDTLTKLFRALYY